MSRKLKKKRQLLRRRLRIRKKIRGTAHRPRFSVHKSNRHTYVQVIDDDAGRTIVAVSNLEIEFRDVRNRADSIAKLGEIAGERLRERNISQVVFDRSGYQYHGIVKSVADGARKSGIKI